MAVQKSELEEERIGVFDRYVPLGAFWGILAHFRSLLVMYGPSDTGLVVDLPTYGVCRHGSS